MMQIWRIVVLLVFLTLSLPSYEQEFFYHRINTSNGVPTNTIYDVAQDSDGKIFIATELGLYSYNGIEFKHIPQNRSISKSGTDIIFTNTTLWFRSFSEQIFYLENGELHLVELNNDSLKNESIIDFVAQGNSLYLVTFNAVYIIDEITKEITTRIPIDEIESACIADEKLLITTIHGEAIIIQDNIIVKTHQLPVGRYRCIYANDVLYCIDRTNRFERVLMLSVNENKNDFVIGEIPFPFVDKIYINNLRYIDGILTLSTNLGTYFYKDKQWRYLNTSQNHTGIIQDFQNRFWISTLDNGLIFIPSLDITLLFDNQKDQYYRNIISSPKGVFVSTNKGLVLEITLDGEIINSYDTNTGREVEFMFFDEENDRLYTSIGYFEYDHPELFKSIYFGKGIGIDEFGNIFSAQSYVGYVFSPNKEIALKLKFSDRGESALEGYFDLSLRYKRSRTLAYNNRRLYFSYVDKMIYHSEEDEIELVNKKGEPLFAKKILFDDNGYAWIATEQDGLYCFDGPNLLHHFSTANGLLNNSCINISIFNNTLYLITLKDITRIDLNSLQLTSITSHLSADNDHIKDIYESENRLIYVTPKGLISTHKETFLEQNFGKILNLKISSANKTQFNDLNRIPSSNNTLYISWETLDYTFGKKHNLKYRLVGLDESWSEIPPTTDFMIYNNISPGKYRFEIVIEDDINTLKSISFTIHKPIWQTLIYIAIIILGSSFLIWLTYNLTKQYFQKRQYIKEQLIMSQLTALRSQMNPHFLYNVLNSLQGLIYSNKTNEAGNYVSMFSDHLRHTLHNSSKQDTTIKEEMESLEIYLELEKLRFGEDFNYYITKDENIDDKSPIPSMILQPFVENAVKHGLLHKKGGKRVDINFKMLKNNVIQISIIDNGIGRIQSTLINQQRKDKPESFATQAIDDRIELLNKGLRHPIRIETIDLEKEGKATGTAVYVIIDITSYMNSRH